MRLKFDICAAFAAASEGCRFNPRLCLRYHFLTYELGERLTVIHEYLQAPTSITLESLKLIRDLTIYDVNFNDDGL